jgi:hypothetical protein
VKEFNNVSADATTSLADGIVVSQETSAAEKKSAKRTLYVTEDVTFTR